jgi:hypothetical protein
MSVAHRLATKYGWDQEKVEANKVRVDGGCFDKDKWVEEKNLITPEQKQVLKDLNLWRK